MLGCVLGRRFLSLRSHRPGRHIFTSESVTEGHPDKLCDQLSDAVLDECLRADPMSRVAVDVVTKTGFVMLVGELTTTAHVDFDEVARRTITEIGYDCSTKGFDGNTCAVQVCISKQSPDIKQGVDRAADTSPNDDDQVGRIGAGDQGMMFGFACNETPTLMPLPIDLAHRLCKQLALVRKTGALPWLRPDGKSQVSVEYEDGVPLRVDAIVLAAHHAPTVDNSELHAALRKHVIDPVVPPQLRDGRERIFINPTGRFVVGGPLGDSGLTGRKVMVDSYGSAARHGGGAFSGKDPTKVDRSAAYAARWVAKNVVAAGLADVCELQVAYAIGVAAPVSITTNTYGTGQLSDEQLGRVIQSTFDLRPGAILRDLRLRRPIYRQTAAYGHFGRDDIDAPWEQTNMVPRLLEAAQRV